MNTRLIFLLILCCFAKPLLATELLGLKQQTNGSELLITPHFEVAVSQKVIDAIDNGIVITFVYQAKLYHRIDWWFDTVIESKLHTFEVRYFSLTSEYRLHHINNKNILNFTSLYELLEHLGQQTNFVFNADETADYIETRIFLDKQALPSIMQLPNVFDADWNLNSDWQQVAISVADESLSQP